MDCAAAVSHLTPQCCDRLVRSAAGSPQCSALDISSTAHVYVMDWSRAGDGNAAGFTEGIFGVSGGGIVGGDYRTQVVLCKCARSLRSLANGGRWMM